MCQRTDLQKNASVLVLKRHRVFGKKQFAMFSFLLPFVDLLNIELLNFKYRIFQI